MKTYIVTGRAVPIPVGMRLRLPVGAAEWRERLGFLEAHGDGDERDCVALRRFDLKRTEIFKCDDAKVLVSSNLVDEKINGEHEARAEQPVRASDAKEDAGHAATSRRSTGRSRSRG